MIVRRLLKMGLSVLLLALCSLSAYAEPPEFTVPDVPSDAVPTVTSTAPATGTTGVSIDAGDVEVVFNGSDLSIDLTKDYEITEEGSSTSIAGTATYSTTLKKLTIPYDALEESTIYEVSLPHNLITEGGNPMDDDYSWHFSTGTTPIETTDDSTPEEEEEEEEDDTPDPPEEEEITPGDLKITDHTVWPKGFNPLLAETKITYEISEDAIIKVKILNDTGVTVVTLIDDEEVDEGKYDVWWNGTDSTEDDGEVVSGGTYHYKILASDPDSEELRDSETGSINVVYTYSGDFEGEGDQTTTGEETDTAETEDDQNAAIMTMQNTVDGVTSDTGPGILIYSIFPLGGFLIRKRWKK